MENDARANEHAVGEPEHPRSGGISKAVMVIAAAAVAFYFAYSYAAYLKAPSASFAYGSGAGGAQADNASYSGATGAGSCCGSGAPYGSSASYGATPQQNAGGLGSGGCCGSGGSGPQIAKETRVDGDKQYVDMIVNGGWNPNVIKAKAELPLTINLDVQQAGGCISALVFPQLNVNVPLQSGAKTKLELPPLKPGTYSFSCQMGMVNGQLVVE